MALFLTLLCESTFLNSTHECLIKELGDCIMLLWLWQAQLLFLTQLMDAPALGHEVSL